MLRVVHAEVAYTSVIDALAGETLLQSFLPMDEAFHLLSKFEEEPIDLCLLGICGKKTVGRDEMFAGTIPGI